DRERVGSRWRGAAFLQEVGRFDAAALLQKDVEHFATDGRKALAALAAQVLGGVQLGGNRDGRRGLVDGHGGKACYGVGLKCYNITDSAKNQPYSTWLALLCFHVVRRPTEDPRCWLPPGGGRCARWWRWAFCGV